MRVALVERPRNSASNRETASYFSDSFLRSTIETQKRFEKIAENTVFGNKIRKNRTNGPKNTVL